MMVALRSYAFLAMAFVWTFGLGFLYLPLLAGPRRWHRWAVHAWSRGLMGMLAAVCGLRLRLEGGEHIPTGPAVIAAKHQSAWETIALNYVLDQPVFILKKELLRIPLIGWHFRKGGCIAIDRAMGTHALRAMIPAARAALAEGSQVIVFPEGTRVAPGVRRPYQPGVAAMYTRTDAPVVPVALNSGCFWGRRSVTKKPGVITLQFLPAIPPGLDRRAFMLELEARIETASARLMNAALDANEKRTAGADARSRTRVE